jgi:hypothetical protein
MKILQISLAMLVLLCIAGCNNADNPTNPTNADQSATRSASPLLRASGASASGQGRIVGTDRVFAFNATTAPDGTVRGQGQLTYTHNGGDVKIHFMIDCMSVAGNVAIVSGTVLQSTIFEPGGPFWFKVVDNGEGKNALPDEMTGFLFCSPGDPDPLCAQLTCGNDLQLALNPVENGNIQVKP